MDGRLSRRLEIQVVMGLETGVRDLLCPLTLFGGGLNSFSWCLRLEPRTKLVAHELGDEKGAKASGA